MSPLIKLGPRASRKFKTALDLDLDSCYSTKWGSMTAGDTILLVLSFTVNGFSRSRLLVPGNTKGQLALNL